MVGGVQWLSHVGMTRPAAMNLAMAFLVLVGAIWFLREKPIPKTLAVAAIVLSALHLFNAIGTYLIYDSNGRVLVTDPTLMLPFRLMGGIFPTNSIFTDKLVGNGALLALPFVSLVVVLWSIFMTRKRVPGCSQNDA